MSRTFDLATGPNYSINSVGSCASLGNGAYTIIALFNINTGNNNFGLISFRTAGINAELSIDGNQIFGASDFGGGQTGVTVSTWWWAAIRKAAGSSVYTYSLRQYNTGSTSHQSGVATHADSGATNTTIRLGDSDDRSNGLIAVLAAWTSSLSDGQVAGMFTTAAADVAAQSPQGLWLGNQASSSDPINDSAGSANQTSVNGAIGVGSDPPSYNYSLSGSTAVWIPVNSARRRVQPPRRPAHIATPVRPQVNPPVPLNAIKQPRQLRGRLPRRGASTSPVPAQVVVTAPNLVPSAVRARIKALRPFRSRTAVPPIAQAAPVQAQRPRLKLPRIFRGRSAQPVPAQVVVTAPPYPPQAVRARMRGLRAFRSRAASVVPAQVVVAPPAYPPTAVRARLRGLRMFRGRTAAPVPPQAAVVPPSWVPPALRARVKGLRPARPHVAVPPVDQVMLPVAPRVRLRPVVPRHGHASAPTPAQVIVAAPAYVPNFARAKKRLARIWRGAARFVPFVDATPVVLPRRPTVTVDLARASTTSDASRATATADLTRPSVPVDL